MTTSIPRLKTKAQNRNRNHLSYNRLFPNRMTQMLEEQWEVVQVRRAKIWTGIREVPEGGPDLDNREMILNHSKMLQSICILNLMLSVNLKKIFKKLEIFLESEDLIKKVIKLINRLSEMSMIWLKTMYK